MFVSSSMTKATQTCLSTVTWVLLNIPYIQARICTVITLKVVEVMMILLWMDLEHYSGQYASNITGVNVRHFHDAFTFCCIIFFINPLGVTMTLVTTEKVTVANLKLKNSLWNWKPWKALENFRNAEVATQVAIVKIETLHSNNAWTQHSNEHCSCQFARADVRLENFKSEHLSTRQQSQCMFNAHRDYWISLTVRSNCKIHVNHFFYHQFPPSYYE